jgi:hypothetical protein
MVTPLIWHAAIPVEAVTKVVADGSLETIWHNRNDFPTPAPPVRKT